MTNFKEMWIPCSEQEYPEVKQLLEMLKYSEFDQSGVPLCKGVTCFHNGTFQAVNFCVNALEYPTVTLPELRSMATPTTTDNIAALETLFANFIEAVAEMRDAQRNYEKTPRSQRPEALGIRLKHEREVDAMINDVTRKP